MEITTKDLDKIFKNPLFDGCNRENALQIFRSCGCEIGLFADGELLRSPESDQRLAGLILSGKATATTPDPSKNTLLRFLENGALFGIANLFSGESYVSVIRAHGSCKVFLMPENAIRSLLESDPVFLYHYLDFLSGRIRFLNRKIGYLTAGSAERRLALYLASFQKQELVLKDSISSLSELLDIGRASLYRAFDKLTADGYMIKEGKRITLLDTDAMLNAYL